MLYQSAQLIDAVLDQEDWILYLIHVTRGVHVPSGGVRALLLVAIMVLL